MEPKRDYKDKIYGIIREITFASSSLQMPPDELIGYKLEIDDEHYESPTIENSLKWGRHAFLHLSAALDLAFELQEEIIAAKSGKNILLRKE